MQIKYINKDAVYNLSGIGVPANASSHSCSHSELVNAFSWLALVSSVFGDFSGFLSDDASSSLLLCHFPPLGELQN